MPKLSPSERFANIVNEFESCSRILDSIQQIAASIENGGDHVALAHAINYIATDYQGHLSNVSEMFKTDSAI